MSRPSPPIRGVRPSAPRKAEPSRGGRPSAPASKAAQDPRSKGGPSYGNAGGDRDRRQGRDRDRGSGREGKDPRGRGDKDKKVVIVVQKCGMQISETFLEFLVKFNEGITSNFSLVIILQGLMKPAFCCTFWLNLIKTGQKVTSYEVYTNT